MAYFFWTTLYIVNRLFHLSQATGYSLLAFEFEKVGVWYRHPEQLGPCSHLQGADPGIYVRGRSLQFPYLPPFPFPRLSLFLRSIGPLKQLQSVESAVSSPSGVCGRAPAENEFGVL